MPGFDPPTWRLELGGARRAAGCDSSYDELLALPKVEQVSTFHCVTGWTVKNVALGRRAGAATCSAAASRMPSAHALRFVSAEQPYDDYLTLEQAGLADVMLAYEMDGKPLPRAHGAPLRLVIPEMYGYKNVKWLQRIELVPKAERRLLGAARLRPRRLGRPLERIRHVSAGYVERRFSRTERALPLGERARLLRPARVGARPLPAEPRGRASAAGRS